LKSLDAVLNHVLAAGKGGAPRALLVAGATAKLDATTEAIAIARALAKRERVVLVDLTRGPASISGALGLPRTPGLTDLVAGRAGFEDVVRIDDDSALQVISAGNPKLSGANDDENERFARLFEALTQTYDSVVLHADREAVRQLTPALKFELPIMVAVLPAGAGDSGVKTDLAEFSALGCPVLVYEQTGKQPRSRFFDRVAAG
jgi:Mrp family chromosome partitioning ATPase